MHPSALTFGENFFRTYCSGKDSGRVIDIGAQDVNGSLRDVCPSHLEYIGVDFIDARGVDIVLKNPYELPFPNESIDFIVCSSVFEHSQFFWVLFLEILRVLKPDGIFYLNVPSNGYIHRYPVDCWRFYPDSGLALVEWGKSNGFSPALLESFTGIRASLDVKHDAWNDFVAVFIRDSLYVQSYPERILDNLKDYTNAYIDTNSFDLNSSHMPEDFLVIQKMESLLIKREATLAARNTEFDALTQALAVRNAEFDALTEVFAVRNAEFDALLIDSASTQLTLAQTLNDINQIKMSKSWRITAIFRFFGHLTRKLKSCVQTLFSAPLNIYKLQNLKKAYVIFEVSGFKGLIKYIEKRISAEKSISPARLPKSMLVNKEEIIINPKVLWRIDKAGNISDEDDVLIYVAYCPTGVLSALQMLSVSEYSKSGYKVILVINTDQFFDIRESGANEAIIQITRENIGYDFGAWRDSINVIGGLASKKSITFTNDSICHINFDSGIARQKKEIEFSSFEVVFLTSNYEINFHYQSYFFSVKNSALNKNVLNFMKGIEYYQDKSLLIYEVEVNLYSDFNRLGISTGALYEVDEAEFQVRNPTIHFWRKLISRGYPFFKIQLVTSNIVDLKDRQILTVIPQEIIQLLERHCNERVSAKSDKKIYDDLLIGERSMKIDGIFNSYKAQQAFNPVDNHLPVFSLPFSNIEVDEARLPKVLAVIHCYYLDIALILLSEIKRLDFAMNLLLTTDSVEKRNFLVEQLSLLKLSGSVVVCPNKGRDVAPFVVETLRYLEDEELILHLHTKKSLHESRYQDWGAYLIKNLIGSREIVLSILQILQHPTIGIVYSEHYSEVKNLRNWGYDFPLAKKILDSIGVNISGSGLLEFPSSTMFWAKRDAIFPLINMGLTYKDFEPEDAQTDGTLAHSIERVLLFIAEKQGYSSVQVSAL